MIQTDILIIGAGPCGLFTVFEAGLLKLRCHLIDALPQPGGQCAEIYPKKPIYDIPAYPSILAGELVDRLMEQAEPFKPGFTFERAEQIEKDDEDQFIVTTNRGTQHRAPIIAIAGGLGCFEPRAAGAAVGRLRRQGRRVHHQGPRILPRQEGGDFRWGDSALDWTIFLAEGVASEVTLVHRRKEFRGHLDSVQKVMDLAAAGRVKLMTDAEVIGVDGDGQLASVEIKTKADGNHTIETDHWVPLFGLSPSSVPLPIGTSTSRRMRWRLTPLTTARMSPAFTPSATSIPTRAN